jgi:biopolymer transport protein ExbB
MEMIYQAGPLVAVLFFVSILTIAFALERFWALNLARGKIRPETIFPQIKELIEKGDLAGAQERAEAQLGSVGRVLASVVKKYRAITGRLAERGMREELGLAIREANAMEGALLERNIIPIATIGSIANLIGLLGTVVGMIQSFAAISATGVAEKIAAAKLAQGIATALINAAGGLVVAIMAVIFYNYFLHRIDRIIFNMEENSSNLLELCLLTERKRDV